VTATAIETITIGFGNVVAAARVIVVARAESSPIRRLIESAARENRLIDATNGRRTRSVLVTDSNHVILSHAMPRSLANKLSGGNLAEEAADDDDGDTA
jgi:regulator of extracellular matrix RemA (YlzA/DUF370 family)